MGIKKCLCGCGHDRFSHGYAKYCQHKRTDNKKPKRTILKHTERKPVHTIHFGFDDQLSMFEWLWEQSRNKQGRVICPYTGNDLTDLENGTVERWVCCFAHVLSKKNYIYFRLNPANVKIVNPLFHLCIDAGTLADRAKHPDWKWELWDSLVIRMKAEYLMFKSSNLLA